MTQAAVVPATQMFAYEIDQAKRLGYEVKIKMTGVAAVVRLVPKTQKAKAAAKRAAPEQTQSPELESVVAFDMPRHRVDALHAALQAVLAMARDAAA